MATKKSAALKAAAAAAVCTLLTVCSQGSRDGAEQGIKLCLGVLAPSLFPFMAVTQLFARCGIFNRAGRLLHRPAKRIFGLSGALVPVLIMSLIGGYPVGAAGAAALYSQGIISEKEARHAALFMVCAGPGFVISFTGATLLNSAETGAIILASQASSVIITGLFARLIFGKNDVQEPAMTAQPPSPSFYRALVESVAAAARGMLMICAFAVLFSSVTGILGQLIKNEAVQTACAVALEVSGAVSRLAKNGTVEQIAFAIGFGGLCVHCQIFAALGDIGISKPLFFLFRIIQGLLTALLTHFVLKLLPRETAVFSTSQVSGAALFGGSLLSGALLIGVIICFLISVKQIRQ